MDHVKVRQTAEYVTEKIKKHEDVYGNASFKTFADIAFDRNSEPLQYDPEWQVQFIGMSSSQWAKNGTKALPAGVLNDDANEYGDVCTIQVRQAPSGGPRLMLGPPYMVRVNGERWVGLPPNPLKYDKLKVKLVRTRVAVPVAEAPDSGGGAAAAAPHTAAAAAAPPTATSRDYNSSSSSDDDESDLLPPHTHAGGGLMF